MRNTNLFLPRDASHPTRRLCYSGPANTQWNRSNFMTRKVPIGPRHHYRNVIVHNCRCRRTRASFPARVLTIPRKAFE